MLFTSYTFIFFLFLLILAYYLIPKKYQWMLLLAASYIFYFFSGISNVIYILVTTITTYFASIKIGILQKEQTEFIKANKETLSREERKEYKEKMKSKQRKFLVLCLVFNFGILAVLKYTNFMLLNINSVIRLINPERELSFLNILIPLGISFYTFQSMGYLIDVYRERFSYERNFFKLSLFISFFPQLIQGPISRFNDLKDSLFREHKYDQKNITFGLQRILWGYFKKLVIADRLLIAVSTIVGEPGTYKGTYVVLGMFFYAIELYCDFSGGIDIAIGISEVLGISLKENFERPFFSKSIAEYWRRWHITLGTWFKDYMFYPISVSKPILNLSDKSRKRFGNKIGKRIPVYISTLIVWFTTGIWHGASWNFVVWGMLNGIIILISYECTPLYEKFHNRFNVINTLPYRAFMVVRTFWLMCILRTFDCYKGVFTTIKMFGTVFTSFKQPNLLKLGLTVQDYIVLLLATLLVLTISLLQRKGSVRDRINIRPLPIRYAINFSLFLAILIFGAYGFGYDASQFIYSQF